MTDPIRFTVGTRSGKVRIAAVPGLADLRVRGGHVHDDHHGGVLIIRRNDNADLIEIECPVGSDAMIGTTSGKVVVEGDVGRLRIATVSGRVKVATAEHVDVRSSSGKIEVANCAGQCRVVVKSGKVHVGQAGRVVVATVSGVVNIDRAGGAEVKTVSGKVHLGTTVADRVAVHSVSGTVEVEVPESARPATRLRSVTGNIQCDCANGDGAELVIATVSGAIRVSCTS